MHIYIIIIYVYAVYILYIYACIASKASIYTYMYRRPRISYIENLLSVAAFREYLTYIYSLSHYFFVATATV